MIAHLSGVLRDKALQRLVIDVGGVGYDVLVPLSTLYGLGEPGAPVSLRIYTHVREDALQLFGFATLLELQLFERLIGVSVIGPKLAIAVLSGMEPAEFVNAVGAGDVGRLTSIPGVGKKTAERIVVELRDRLAAIAPAAAPAAAGAQPDLRNDLLSALANLGYQRAAVEKTIDRVLRQPGPHELEQALRDVLRDVTS
jgi:Holliday junction DNA helicase RuvA